MIQQRFKHIWENLRGSNIRGMRILRYIRGVVLIFCSPYFPHNFPIFPLFLSMIWGSQGTMMHLRPKIWGSPTLRRKRYDLRPANQFVTSGVLGSNYPLVNIPKTIEKSHFSEGNQVFLWLFSIAIC